MATALEERIVQRGHRIYDLIEGQAPSLFKKGYWTTKMMDWAMCDETFKTEMFRFVDVFPALDEPGEVTQHLREYFARPEQHFPELLQWGIKAVPPDSSVEKVLAAAVGSNIKGMGRQFILGETPQEALPVIRKLREDGFAITIDLLGETVVSEQEAEGYLRRYLELLDVLAQEQTRWPGLGDSRGDLDWRSSPKVNISVKASAMYSQMNACAFDHSIALAKERLRPIFRQAMKMNAFVNLDMEHRALKNLTLGLYRSLMEEPEFRHYPHTGIALQGYLRDTETDIEQLVEWCRADGRRVTVRLVKGAYWDGEVMHAEQRNWPVPVFRDKRETDANFEKAAGLILKNNEFLRLACGSHNIRPIAAVLETARELHVPADRFEFQILYGMAEPVRNALLKEGLRLRLYSPIGELVPGMAYLVRRLLENTSNESFLRQTFRESVSKQELLRDPRSSLGANGASTEAAGPSQAASSPAKKGPAKAAPRKTKQGQLQAFRNEPPLDWTLAEHRERFSEALKSVRKKFPISAPLVIGQAEVEAGSSISSLNPNDPGETIGVAASAGAAEAERAMGAAKAAFREWRDVPREARAEHLFKAAEAARKQRCELAALEVFEAGKTWSEADGDVCEAIDFLEYYGREMIRLGTPRRMGRAPGEASYLFYEPRGVATVIAPWNFPLAISMGMVSAAIVTGNAVIYKPSSDTPITGYMVSKLFQEAGLPSGVLNYLPGPGGEIGDLLVSHPDAALIAFTGSKEVGLRIVRLAGENPEQAPLVKRVVAEMGGKNAIIVDDDANLDEAVSEILHSAFAYQGQKCSACSRLILLEEIHDRFVDRLRAAAESLYLGPTEDPRSYMGAVISASAKRKVEDYIKAGKQEGTLVIERKPDDAQGHFVPLTIFTDIRPEHRLAQEEIFGPVLSVMKAKTFAEAIEIANGTEFALTGSVFSRSPRHIAEAKQRFQVGNLYINRGCTGAIVERHPFGGFKMSGVGSKAGGPDYLLQFMLPRNVVENTIRRGFAPTDGAVGS